MTDRTRHEIDLIDSANKHRTYKKKEKEKLLQKFEEWLKTCPVTWYETNHPSSDIVCINFYPDTCSENYIKKND
nr:hypothetical protein [uncultured Mediterranean phage uvMED]